MTREEVIIHLKGIKSYIKGGYMTEPEKREVEALNMAIEALEQEPCEDAISRQAAIDTFGLSEKTRKYGGDHSGYDTIMLYEVQDALEALPSVNPHKTGHWKERRNRATGHIETVCSECGAEEGYPYNDYCGNCGAKMVDPMESEV